MANLKITKLVLPLTAVSIFGLLGATLAVGSSDPATIPPAPPVDAPMEPKPRPEPRAPLSDDEQTSLKASLKASLNAQGQSQVSGPETKGATINVGNHTVKLPEDAWVHGYMIAIECQPWQGCLQPPIYRIRRGSSLAFVEVRSGKVQKKIMGTDPANSFDFLDGLENAE